ncbi:GATOR complex protein NPRL2-like [Actinia tenebrosa]|uniref:GATOR complex protein NPRL2-like n=1 Tax=Actinia tenebrosa TaxID=6105 RepID=A0A6P8J283_ACTTE|nr:GATOR complex protein NPRL2-like [Actinia tenebrosa]
MTTDQIKCILFCEFHPIAGPKIVYQSPDNFISKEEFDCVAVYIIPKPELQSKVITVNALNYKFVGCPVSIENAKYSRNALLFNVCFVFGSTSDTISYEGVVKKLANYLTTLELEDGFLSNEESKETLPEILWSIRTKLNEVGKCTITIDEANTIHLKPDLTSKEPCPVNDHDVPIFTWYQGAWSLSEWDISTQQIMPYIDGFNHVLRIANEADMDPSLVRECIQNMVYYNVVKLIPIFQYSNVYIPTPEMNKLVTEKKLQDECITYSPKKGAVLPTFYDVFKLYCGLSPGVTVRDLCARFNPGSLRIDERRLIQFGVMRGLIRRLHKYPVLLTKPQHDRSLRSHSRGMVTIKTGSSKHVRLQPKWLNGRHNYDEICCKTGLSHQELDDIIENDPHVVVVWK